MINERELHWKRWFRTVPPLDRDRALATIRLTLCALRMRGPAAEFEPSHDDASHVRVELLAMVNAMKIAQTALDRLVRHSDNNERIAPRQTERVARTLSPYRSLVHLQHDLIDAERLADRLLQVPVSRPDDVIVTRRAIEAAVQQQDFLCPNSMTIFSFDEVEMTAIPVGLRAGLNISRADEAFNVFALGYARMHWMLSALLDLHRDGVDASTLALLRDAVQIHSLELCRLIAQGGSAALVADNDASTTDVVEATRGVRAQTLPQLNLRSSDIEALVWRTHRSLRETLASVSKQSVEVAQSLIVASVERLRAATTTDEAPAHVPDHHTRRLRDEVWVLRFVLRAFASKVAAHTSNGADGIRSGIGSTSFVDEFLTHFDVFATRVLAHVDYDRSAMLTADVAQLEQQRRFSHTLRRAAAEALRLARRLDEAFLELDASPVLAAIPFNERVPAAALRLYLEEMQAVTRGNADSNESQRTHAPPAAIAR